MSYEPEPDAYEPTDAVARSKVSTPGILLIIVAILNILVGFYWTFRGVNAMLHPHQIEQAFAQMSPEQQKQFDELKKQGFDIQKYAQMGGPTNLALGIIAVLCALVILFGGIQMRNLRGYGLAVFGSILALIPCISPTACCVLGEVAGIWGLVVLMSQDVKSAFR